ncbi:MAG: winged helix DNA-binding domain-containing protein [candidate division Zixibacteria bacterium]|nr:winged helix DNA-binding domain-containing protein [candidate division Zixibacteria bacterium]
MTDRPAIKITRQMARRMAVEAQLLDGGARLPGGKEGTARVIEQLGYIQIDTIAVIERAHHHTLWTRRPDYEPAMLDELQAKDRRIFEYWGHAASYLPMAEYRYYLARMRRFEKSQNTWTLQWREKYGSLMKPVLECVRREGPLTSNDARLLLGKGRKQQEPQAVRAALQLLFWTGEVMIAERRNFQKVYDLTERVLPENLDTSPPDMAEVSRFQVRRALQALGVADEKNIRTFMQPEGARDAHLQSSAKDQISGALEELLDSKEVARVVVDDDESVPYYMVSSMLDKRPRRRGRSLPVNLLSPFDNLVVNRDRIRRLFDFDYALECYVTPAKRKFGYFALPVLWGSDLVGRLDPKADRKQRTLVIQNLLFEKGFECPDDFMAAFADRLQALAAFNQCERVKIKKTTPAGVKKALTTRLREVRA